MLFLNTHPPHAESHRICFQSLLKFVSRLILCSVSFSTHQFGSHTPSILLSLKHRSPWGVALKVPKPQQVLRGASVGHEVQVQGFAVLQKKVNKSKKTRPSTRLGPLKKTQNSISIDKSSSRCYGTGWHVLLQHLPNGGYLDHFDTMAELRKLLASDSIPQIHKTQVNTNPIPLTKMSRKRARARVARTIQTPIWDLQSWRCSRQPLQRLLQSLF